MYFLEPLEYRLLYLYAVSGWRFFYCVTDKKSLTSYLIKGYRKMSDYLKTRQTDRQCDVNYNPSVNHYFSSDNSNVC